MTSTATPDVVAEAEGRKPAALTFWTAVGTLTAGLAIYAWAGWVFSGDAHRVDPGPDHYQYLWYLRVFETVSVAATLFMAWRFVMHPWRTERRVPFDGKVLLGMLLAYYVDPLLNIFNTGFAFNAHAVNFGAWTNFMPAFPSPQQDNLAEGLLWAQPLYMYFGVLAAMLGCALLNLLRRRLPRASMTTIYAVIFIIFVLADVAVELPLIVYPQLYVFPGVPEHFSLFPGTLHQFPLYHAIFAAVFAVMVTWLRDSVDASGRSAVERGIDSIDMAGWRRGITSYLAVTGFCTVAALGYFLPFAVSTMTADTYVELPSYLEPASFCGADGPECPSQYLDDLQHGNVPR